MRSAALLALAASLALASPSRAAGDPNDPAWPCVQRKVPDLSLATVWAGPEIDLTAPWQADLEVARLAQDLAQRRVSLEDADQTITDFAARAGAAKSYRLKLLFAGLFTVLDQERKDVIAGIDRFGAKQIAVAGDLKARNAALDALRSDPKADPAAVSAKTDEVLWDTRVFEDRQRSLTYVCEVPVLIEQRLFHLGKTIAQAIKEPSAPITPRP